MIRHYYDGEYPFVQTGDITAAEISSATILKLSMTLGLSVSKMFPKATLVMSIAANVGDVAILDFDACFPDSMVGLVPNHHTNLDYLLLPHADDEGDFASAPRCYVTTQLNLNYVRIGTNLCRDSTQEVSKKPSREFFDEKARRS